MTCTTDAPEKDLQATMSRRAISGAAWFGMALSAVNCSSGSSGNGANSCTPGDADGITGAGNYPVLVNVSDTGFAVGGVDSGSTESNITTQNIQTVTLTLTNVGTKPHDMVIECIPTGLPAGCAQTSCFPNPDDAGSTPGSTTLVPTLQPGASKAVMFVTPAVEGAYTFISDVPGDDTHYDPADGGVTGNLVGEFNLM
jgi:hypothetical protein